MVRSVRFSPQLGDWIVENLSRGAPPGALVQTMQAQQMEPGAALAIVNAFVAARSTGRPAPLDTVEWDAAGTPDYLIEAPRLPAGPVIATSDRQIRVLARAQRPALAVLADVLSADECRQLIELARARLTPSTLVDLQSGRDVVSTQRRSFGMFFRVAENPFIARIDKRLAELMNLPLENGEGIQVLHYPTGGGSDPHFDFLLPANPANQASLARSGQRVSTLVTYLNDVECGGETAFPHVGWAVTPQRGHAVHFEYGNSLGQLDEASIHASEPVTTGEKWVATKWMRERRFVPAGATH
jgi:prolyl 4-hydroxylase